MSSLEKNRHQTDVESSLESGERKKPQIDLLICQEADTYHRIGNKSHISRDTPELLDFGQGLHGYVTFPYLFLDEVDE
ncbi:hypothetical protein Tco_0603571 [Tanacetum coccineum]